MNSSKIRLLVYNDSPDFGGHEVMTLRMLDYLLDTHRFAISFIYSSRNQRLGNELERIQQRFPNLVLTPTEYATGRLQMFRTIVSLGALGGIRGQIRDFRPDCLLAVQGDIIISSLGVLAGLREGVLTVSYIPLAHTRRQKEESATAWLKDAVLWWYYRLPHRYITISDSMRSMLRERGVKQPIDVVENGIDPWVPECVDKARSREQLGLSRTGFLVALCGRIEFNQKGQDLLLRALAGRAKEFADWTFLVVGDGSDSQRLQRMIGESAEGHKIKILPWQKSMSLLYCSIDMVIIPSRFEGVPVVMLEAMQYGLPIVASSADAMAESLPKEWLFPVGDSDALADAMLRVRLLDNREFLELNKQVVATRFNVERLKREFAQILIEAAKREAV